MNDIMIVIIGTGIVLIGANGLLSKPPKKPQVIVCLHEDGTAHSATTQKTSEGTADLTWNFPSEKHARIALTSLGLEPVISHYKPQPAKQP